MLLGISLEVAEPRIRDKIFSVPDPGWVARVLEHLRTGRIDDLQTLIREPAPAELVTHR